MNTTTHHCPNCDRLLDDLKAFTNHDNELNPGDIILCGDCACVIEVTTEIDDFGTKTPILAPLSELSYETFDADERRDLNAAVRAAVGRALQNQAKLADQNFITRNQN